MRWRKWSILDLFSVLGWPYRAKKRDHVLIFFPMFSVFLCICSRLLDHVFSLFYFPYLLNSSYFYYKYGTIQHAIYTVHNHNYIHKHTHIHIHIHMHIHIHIHMHILLFFEDSSEKGYVARVTFQRRRRRQHFSLFPLVFTPHRTQHTAHLKGKARGISGEGSFRKWRKTNRTIW